MNCIMSKITTHQIRVFICHMVLEMKISLFTSISDGLGENSEMGKVTSCDEEKEMKGKGREDEVLRLSCHHAVELPISLFNFIGDRTENNNCNKLMLSRTDVSLVVI